MDNKEHIRLGEQSNLPDEPHAHIKEQSQEQDVTPHVVLKLIRHPLFAPGIYTLSGVFVFVLLITLIAFNLLFLKVETAVISTPIEAIVAPASGYITEVYVRLGERVNKGKPLLKIENLDLERDLNLARVHVAESKLNADYYEQLIATEQQRLKIYKQIGHNRVISRKTLVNIAKQQALTAQLNLERYTQLYEKHYVSQTIWQGMQAQYFSAQEQVKNSQAQHRMEEHSLNALDQGMYFTGAKTEGIERDLNAELAASQKRIQLNEERVKIYEHLISRLTILAPFDGTVTQILKSAGNTTDTVNPIIFIESAQENKRINAYLTQNEVMKIGLSKIVKVHIPSSGATYHGRVVKINRTDGFIDAIKAQYRWRDVQMDRTAMITIEIQPEDKKNFDEHTCSGMPVIVYFSKNRIF
jgi:multidrug resistance efflux pump